MHVADDETRRPDPLTAIASGAEALARGADLDQALEALRSEEHTSELQSLRHLVCRLLLEKKKHAELVRRAGGARSWVGQRSRRPAPLQAHVRHAPPERLRGGEAPPPSRDGARRDDLLNHP